MRVRAIATGFDNLTIREIDDEFNMPDGATGSWFVPVVAKAETEAERPSFASQKQGKGKHESLA